MKWLGVISLWHEKEKPETKTKPTGIAIRRKESGRNTRNLIKSSRLEVINERFTSKWLFNEV